MDARKKLDIKELQLALLVLALELKMALLRLDAELVEAQDT